VLWQLADGHGRFSLPHYVGDRAGPADPRLTCRTVSAEAGTMHAQLSDFFARPEPFSRYTTRRLWTDPHVAQQMLAAHLDPAHDLASRRPAIIDGFVSWLDRRIGLAGRRVLDLGCGPGLYCERMALRGARVTGLDFSARSLAHARRS